MTNEISIYNNGYFYTSMIIFTYNFYLFTQYNTNANFSTNEVICECFIHLKGT